MWPGELKVPRPRCVYVDEHVRIPGDRDVQASLDGGDGRAVVVACPPHPQHGGSRTDARLRAVSGSLRDEAVDCLRLDYGPWDEGRGEQQDVRNGLRWARDAYDRVGCFGYSFGASMVILVAADESDVAAVSALAPAATAGDGYDVVAGIEAIPCPVQVIVGENDSTVDWEPVREAARTNGHATASVGGDHFFVGDLDRVAQLAGAFLAEHC